MVVYPYASKNILANHLVNDGEIVSTEKNKNGKHLYTGVIVEYDNNRYKIYIYIDNTNDEQIVGMCCMGYYGDYVFYDKDLMKSVKEKILKKYVVY
jgi:hypothetical protein